MLDSRCMFWPNIQFSRTEYHAIQYWNPSERKGNYPVLRLLKDAAEHCTVAARCRKVSKYFLQNLHIEECQIDELWSFVMKKEKNLTPLDEIAGAFGDQWIWISIDATHKTIPFFVVGKHTLKNAIALIQGLKNITNGHIPFLLAISYPTIQRRC